jgi:hypothetical protein
MRAVNYIILSLVVFSNFALSQSGAKKHHAQMPLDCQECHSCSTPTYEKPCLKILPEFTRSSITIFDSADKAPEIIKIDTLKGDYEATIFTHKLHAEMAFMSGGCKTCHHFNPPGKVLTCIECHQPQSAESDLSKPGLKGAYHRQCLNCHREWSHSTNCTVCHERKDSGAAKASIDDKAEFKKVSHPNIETPGKVVYNVDFDDGPIVTFFHDEHINLFNLSCENCHQNESCARCHDTLDKKAAATEKEPHENCIGCHESDIDDNCTKCHDTKERKPFDHANTGWPLNKYHKKLYCNECHGSTGVFKKLNKNCTSCHKNWTSGKFNHKVTGLVLDETHIENDCENCHLNRNFSKKPVCTECHDDMSYPANVPGKIIN